MRHTVITRAPRYVMLRDSYVVHLVHGQPILHGRNKGKLRYGSAAWIKGKLAGLSFYTLCNSGKWRGLGVMHGYGQAGDDLEMMLVVPTLNRYAKRRLCARCTKSMEKTNNG